MTVFEEQVRKMTSAAHAQSLGQPAHCYRCLGSQLGCQFDFERMSLPPTGQLHFGYALGLQRLPNQSFGFGLHRLTQLWPIMPLATLLLNIA